jgi:hypothetical protein
LRAAHHRPAQKADRGGRDGCADHVALMHAAAIAAGLVGLLHRL